MSPRSKRLPTEKASCQFRPLPQAVMFASRTGFLTREETAELIKGLVDILVVSPKET